MLQKQNAGIGQEDTKDSWKFDREVDKQLQKKLYSREDVGFESNGAGVSFSSRRFAVIADKNHDDLPLCFIFPVERISLA